MPVIDQNALRVLREARGWNQRMLCEVASVDPAVLSRLERGVQDDVSASALVALARALDTPIEALLTPPPDAIARALAPEWTGIVRRVSALSIATQRHVARIVKVFLSTLPDEDAEPS